MLTKLSIHNYALIDHVNVSFTNGLTTITGETGAGKSILLGGLGLILGNRADSNAMLNPDEKCIIEGEFAIDKYNLQSFFNENDLDYEPHTVIRRELIPGGKSRAFVNDTPVRLEILTELQSQLIDVHSQHQTLQLNEQKFQFEVIDAIAGTEKECQHYKTKKTALEHKQNDLEALQIQIEKEKEQFEYNLHLQKELELAVLKPNEMQELELEQDRLSHIELIQQNLTESYKLLSEEDFGIHARLYAVKTYLEKIKNYSISYQEIFERTESTFIELTDLNRELSLLVENEQFEPNELEKISARLQMLYNLMQKHRVQTLDDLIRVYRDLTAKVQRITDSDAILKREKEALDSLKAEVTEMAHILFEKRKKHTPDFEKEVTRILRNLGMNEADFKVQMEASDRFNAYGINTLQWMFSANKGNTLGLVKQVASGGEMSRIMLAVKSILAKKSNLPTLIFDEIDTGVSGEVAVKMAEIMKNMSLDMQVICITHLPQIASKGEQHLKVYKEANLDKTNTQIKNLSETERLKEIAEMLGGKQLSETAINHAAELLKFKN